MRTLLLVLAIIPIAAGCTGMQDGVICTELFAYGVNVSLTDDAGQPISGATLTLTEGEHTETMEELMAGEYAGAGERAGTYTLTIDADGFEQVTMEGIVVDEDECHVIGVAHDVSLIRT